MAPLHVRGTFAIAMSVSPIHIVFSEQRFYALIAHLHAKTAYATYCIACPPARLDIAPLFLAAVQGLIARTDVISGPANSRRTPPIAAPG